eukprot:UN21883
MLFMSYPGCEKHLPPTFILKWLPIIRISKVIAVLRTMGDIEFSKGFNTPNYIYHNENLFRSIDMIWVLFDENYF